MNDRKTAKIVGLLFIIGTVAGSFSVILTESILHAPDLLSSISENRAQVIAGAFLELVMAAAVTAIPYVLFPILKRRSERIAIGYIGARTMEGVGYVVSVIALLSLASVSQEFIRVGASEASTLQTLGTLLLAGREWVTLIGVYIVFNLGALLFYYLLYKSRLIPRFLSVWGFIAALMWLTGVLLIMFDITTDSSTIYTLSFIPMFAQEMVMAVWLIIKGFSPSLAASESIKK